MQSSGSSGAMPLLFRMRRILLPVMKRTWATPWESLRITPIWEGVRPFLANLKIWSLTSSLVIFRDSHGVAQVRFITGNKILRILKSKGMAPELPEDCYHLIKKAVSIRKHLERNRKDRDAKFRLILVESRIHRLARYYKLTGVLPPTWKYESSTASTMVA